MIERHQKPAPSVEDKSLTKNEQQRKLRFEREAHALRKNLRRRKEQSRHRDVAKSKAP